MEKMAQKLNSLKNWKNKKKLQLYLKKTMSFMNINQVLTTTDYTQIDSPRPNLKPKTPRSPEPRMEKRIVIKTKRKEYLDNYQYHEAKNIKNAVPRFKVTVEIKRLGDIISYF